TTRARNCAGSRSVLPCVLAVPPVASLWRRLARGEAQQRTPTFVRHHDSAEAVQPAGAACSQTDGGGEIQPETAAVEFAVIPDAMRILHPDALRAIRPPVTDAGTLVHEGNRGFRPGKRR